MQRKYVRTKEKLNIQTQVQIQCLSALRKIDLSMTTNKELQTTLMIVTDQGISQLHVDAANIYVLNKDSQNLEWKAGKGLTINRLFIPKLQNPGISVLESGNQIYKMQLQGLHFQTDGLNRDLCESGFSQYLVCPLQYNGVFLGTLEILHHKILQLNDDFTSYLETLAGQAAITIEHESAFTNLQYGNTHIQGHPKK